MGALGSDTAVEGRRAHRGDLPFIAPSLDLNVQLHHHVPDSPWLLAIGQAPVAHRGTIGCLGRVWAADGRLAAMGTGTCLCTPPPLTSWATARSVAP